MKWPCPGRVAGSLHPVPRSTRRARPGLAAVGDPQGDRTLAAMVIVRKTTSRDTSCDAKRPRPMSNPGWATPQSEGISSNSWLDPEIPEHCANPRPEPNRLAGLTSVPSHARPPHAWCSPGGSGVKWPSPSEGTPCPSPLWVHFLRTWTICAVCPW